MSPAVHILGRPDLSQICVSLVAPPCGACDASVSLSDHDVSQSALASPTPDDISAGMLSFIPA